MKKRSVFAVLLLPFVTLGIYSIYWQVKTKGEMVKLGADIPTAWLIIIPFVNIWWLWKYSQGVEHVTGGKMGGVIAFLLLWLLGFIGEAIVQDSFNNVTVAVAGSFSGAASAGQAPTTTAFTPPTAGVPPTQPVSATPAQPQNGQSQQPPASPNPPASNPPMVSG